MSRPRALLLLILVVSAALRIWIACRGGQNFWPDEGRYSNCIQAVSDLRHGQPMAAFKEVFDRAGHVFFVVLGLVPAALQSFGMPEWMAAAYFGLFSVGSIYLVGRISWITSRDEEEALLAAAIAAGCASLLYFARHFLAYDAALFFVLLGLYLGLRAMTPRGCFFAGIWISLGFLTYNGYWLLCGVAFVLVTLYRLTSLRAFLARCLGAAAGFAIPITAIFFAERAAGTQFFQGLVSFSHTVTLGDYDEGWTFIWRYLWQTEGWLVGLWVIFAVAGCGVAIAGRKRHLLWWALALVLIYLGLAEMSAGLNRFVIYGRIARCLTPFFALSMAGVLATIGSAGARGRLVQRALLAAILVQVAGNFWPVVTQYFPPEFRAAALEKIKAVPVGERGRLRILNAYFFHQAVFADPPGTFHTLFSAPHPLQYRPYQYEGYRRDQRVQFNSHDITMRLVHLDYDALQMRGMPDSILGGFVGPIRLTVSLPPKMGTFAEPLVVTGRSEKGDFLYVRCSPEAHTIQVGFDHWSYGGPLSDPIPVDFGKPHTFEISMGSLMPPAGSDAYRVHPEWLPLTQWLSVKLDGRTIFNQAAEFYPAEAAEAAVGSNLIGGSSTDPKYAGTLIAVEPLDAGLLVRELPTQRQ